MDSSTNLINPDSRMSLSTAPGGAGSISAATGATDFGGAFGQRMPMLNQFRNNHRMPLIIAVAILAAVIAGLVMWSRQPDYRVCVRNLSDRDGRAILAALQQQNIPYKIAESGGAILVPSESVHETRLRLA